MITKFDIYNERNSFDKNKNLFLEKRRIPRIPSPKERETTNLARRLEYNLKKFFDVERSSGELYAYGYVNRAYNPSGDKYEELSANISILLQPSLEKNHPTEFRVFTEEIDRLDISHFISYTLDEEQAEKLLFSVKNNFKHRLLETEAERYNL